MTNFRRLFLVFCFVFSLAAGASAETYTVTKIADTADGVCDTDCSLREAVIAAEATASSDLIIFSSLFDSAQTIVLSGTDIIMTGNGFLRINGTGANLLTVSGNNQSRVFTNNTGAATTIFDLKITGGNGVSSVQTGRAGGIYNNGGTLSLVNVIVTGNTAANGGGFNNAGTATLSLFNTEVSNNTSTGAGGGGQNFSGSTLNMIGSTFSGNTSNSTLTGGGAIQANGILNIANSTFSGNMAQGGSGGAMFYNGTNLIMNNVTITANTATSNAGGLHKSTNTNNANLRNTIIAGNTGEAASPDATNVFNSLGNNLIGNPGTSTGWVATDILNQNAQLAPLANNGGATRTHALLPTSPAVNAGNNCVTNLSCPANNPPTALTVDQRGQARVGNVDIGAFELGSTVALRPAPFDFDGDGRTDYAVFRSADATWYVQRSTAGFLAVSFGLATDRLTPADYDGDGKSDVAVFRDGNWYILQSSNNQIRPTAFGQAGDVPVPADYDGDGKADLAVVRQGVWYFINSSNNQFRSVQFGLATDKPVPADYDGDGKTDVAVYRDGNWYVLQSSDNSFRAVAFGVASDKAVAGDYDGDGRADQAVYRNGAWYLNRSTQGFAAVQFGTTSDIPTVGDYDGDGKTDVAVWRGTNGTFYLLKSNGNQSVAFQWGVTGDVPIAAAYIR